MRSEGIPGYGYLFVAGASLLVPLAFHISTDSGVGAGAFGFALILSSVPLPVPVQVGTSAVVGRCRVFSFAMLPLFCLPVCSLAIGVTLRLFPCLCLF